MTVTTAANSDKRLRILGPDEIAAIYGRPTFSAEERDLYFTLSPVEKVALESFHSIKSRLYFILQLGYFKSRQQFFIFSTEEVEEDASYLQTTYFPAWTFNHFTVAKVTRLKQQALILDLFHYRYCDAAARQQLEHKAQQVARISSKPIFLFRELLQYLTAQQLVAPGYRVLQEMVGKVLLQEQQRLGRLAQTHLTPAEQTALEALLDNPQGLHELTRLKREPKDFGHREVTQEIARGEQLRPLYKVAQRLLPELEISNENIKYYASLVTYYSIFRLRQLDATLVRVYLLCFAYHRFQKLHDNLIHSFIHHLRRYRQEAKRAAKERVYLAYIEQQRDLPKAGQVLKLFTDERLAPDTPFEEVQAQAFTLLERPHLERVATQLAEATPLDETAFQWEYLDQLAPRFKRRLRPILRAIELMMTSPHEPLLEALQFLKTALGRRNALRAYRPEELPTAWVPEHHKRYLYESGKQGRKHLLVDRYEFLLYRLAGNGLEAGDLFCRDSVRFRRFEDDLLSDQQWQAKEQLFAAAGVPLLKVVAANHLTELEEQLEEQLRHVNQRIASGTNTHLQIKKTTQRWSLPYTRASEAINHPFFDALTQVDCRAILEFADQHCHFMDAFEHVLRRYGKQDVDERVITACLIAWATNMGLGRMSAISDISYQELAATSDNFLRLETLQAANDCLSNAIAQLAIFPHYHIDDAIHSSSDGQKFETQLSTINARHSPKYFGLKKGVVAYTLVANHIPIQARLIGADEHESHYVFDVLFNNTTEVQPVVHSTDTHGTNEVNFAILHFFGYQFAPRYRDLYDKVRTSLYGFKHPSHYEDYLLKPIRKINTDLILEEWDNIQRIIVSLALKSTTQAIIISKLSAYARKNRTRRALWEYDNIIRSLYLLDYIDSLPLRRNVQQALNRGESYHQLRRAVSYANFGKLRFKTEHDQQLWNECSRLLTNCIIFYNASLLSNVLQIKERAGDAQQVARLKQVPPIAWQHINFYGRYEFTTLPSPIDMEAIVQQLASIPIAPDA